MQILRDYQSKALEDLRTHIRAGVRRLLLVAPTGSGKTTIAAAMIHGAVAKQKRILFLAHRRELIDQCCDRLTGLDVPHGVIMAGDPRHDPSRPVQVASVQTLVRRDAPFHPDLIFIDEAHHARADSYTTIVNRHPNATLIGLTATPIRTDGRGLGNLFDVMEQCPDLTALTEMGFLVPVRAWTQPVPDLKGVKKTGGDYNLEQLSQRFNHARLVGNIVTHYRRIASGRTAVVFAVDVAHSRAITEEFKSAGYKAEHLDGETPTSEREAILARLASGETQIVSNCQVLTEGWDCPKVDCVILARPTTSVGLYLQMAGRALRPYPGKENCVLLDHAGCIRTFGFPSEDQNWELTTDKIKPPVRISTADPFKVCPDCECTVGIATKECPNCGYTFSTATPTNNTPTDEHLVEVKPGKALTESRKRQKYEHYLWVACHLKKRDGTPYKPNYPEVCFKNQFGQWPPKTWKFEWLRNQEAAR